MRVGRPWSASALGQRQHAVPVPPEAPATTPAPCLLATPPGTGETTLASPSPRPHRQANRRYHAYASAAPPPPPLIPAPPAPAPRPGCAASKCTPSDAPSAETCGEDLARRILQVHLGAGHSGMRAQIVQIPSLVGEAALHAEATSRPPKRGALEVQPIHLTSNSASKRRDAVAPHAALEPMLQQRRGLVLSELESAAPGRFRNMLVTHGVAQEPASCPALLTKTACASFQNTYSPQTPARPA